MSEGQVKMGPGTLYGSILRMTDAALIEETMTRRQADGEERRPVLSDHAVRQTGPDARIAATQHTVMNVARQKHLLGAPLTEGTS
jgi:hypothetical protein